MEARTERRSPSATVLHVVLAMALGNLIANKKKTFVISGMGACASLVLVLGLSLVGDIDQTIQSSITASITGHIQVYSSKSRDELSLLGAPDGGFPRLEPVRDFARVREILMSTPNVRSVVPMGINMGTVVAGSRLEEALDRLRVTGSELAGSTASTELARQYEEQKLHVQRLLSLLRAETREAVRVSDHAQLKEDMQALEQATSVTFWQTFDASSEERLAFLESRIAPLTSDGSPNPIAYVGTDPQGFAAAFERMQVLEGDLIPAGERGIMLSKEVYEQQFKLKAAHGLDLLAQALAQPGRSIASEPALQRIVRENVAAAVEVERQLNEADAGRVLLDLQAFLQTSEPNLKQLLQALFTTDDSNLLAHQRFFYDVLAPKLALYRVRVGDTLTVQTIARTGYVQSATLRVYGTYAFKGLERAPQANQLNIMDLVTFRELYGIATAEHDEELRALKARAGVRELDHAQAERELFATKLEVQVLRPEQASSVESVLARLHGTGRRASRSQLQHFDPRELREGMALHAAVVLADPTQLPQTLREIELRLKRADLPVQAVTWQRAVGVLGQFTHLLRGLLWAAALIIFSVALVVLNNALIMAALERVREIGTLRALGAQRAFVMNLLVAEALITGALASGLGSLLGVGLLRWLGHVGIPATDDQLAFLFAGSRLFPSASVGAVLTATLAVLGVSLVSGLYPAWLASRVSPRVAMQVDE